VGRIEVRGNYETRDYVIRREMRVQEGGILGCGARFGRNRKV
jgi:outer membrane protein assembly factor BamA